MPHVPAGWCVSVAHGGFGLKTSFAGSSPYEDTLHNLVMWRAIRHQFIFGKNSEARGPVQVAWRAWMYLRHQHTCREATTMNRKAVFSSMACLPVPLDVSNKGNPKSWCDSSRPSRGPRAWLNSHWGLVHFSHFLRGETETRSQYWLFHVCKIEMLAVKI